MFGTGLHCYMKSGHRLQNQNTCISLIFQKNTIDNEALLIKQHY